MAPTLYMLPQSPAVRAVQITAKAVGLEIKEKQIDLFKGEHLTPEYLKLNPLHTVPTLVEEDGFVLYDSHAILPYLASKYAKNDSLYPKDLQKRAIVDQRLHFDNGVAYVTLFKIVVPIHFHGKTRLDDSDKESVDQVYGFVEAFLDGKEWICGDSVTIADYSSYSTITGLDVMHALDPQKFPRVVAWIKKIETLPEVDVSKKGLAAYRVMMKGKMS